MCVLSPTLGLHYSTKQRIRWSSKGLVTGEFTHGGVFCGSTALLCGALLCCILSFGETATEGKSGLKAKPLMQWSSGRCKADSWKDRIHGLENRGGHQATERLGGLKRIASSIGTKYQREDDEISVSMCPARCTCTFTAVNCSHLGLLEIPTEDPYARRRTVL